MIKEFTFVRSRWLRNQSIAHKNDYKYIYPGGRLLNSEQEMCCLGFYCEANGISPDKFRGISMPFGIPNADVPLMTWYNVLAHGTKFADEAARINDSGHTADAEKERLLVAHFKSVGITLKFVD